MMKNIYLQHPHPTLLHNTAGYMRLQDMTTRLASGVFRRSVLTMRGSPPSATLHRYMCRNDFP